MNNITFNCGCSFPVENGLIKFNPSFDNLNLHCQATWDLISSGHTKGIFQLESFLGQRFAHKVKPQNIEELADLVTLLRPGCLQAFLDDGKNVVEHYIMRKFGEEEAKPLHESLRDLLKDTYFLLLYQEQAMSIAKTLAGFSPGETDKKIRKVLGKKQSDKILQVKKDFIVGCEKTGIVTIEEGEIIFSWIEAGQRYSFNLSHAISYSMAGYLSAYVKQHFPLVYIKHSLRHGRHKNKDKKLEMKDIIVDAKRMCIEILCHDLRDNNYEFEIFNKKIKFGLINIKNVGEETYTYIRDNIEDIKACNWLQFLIKHSVNINSRHMISIIDAGALDYMGLNRKYMKFEYEKIVSDLTTRQINLIKELELSEFKSLRELLIYLSRLDTGKDKILSSKKQKEKIVALLSLLSNPPESLEYSMKQIEKIEADLLNFPISCTRLDGNIDASLANTKCYEFENCNRDKNIIIAGIIQEVKFIKTKKGDDMCFITIMDDTGELSDIAGFKEFVGEFRETLLVDNSVLLSGNRSWKNRKSLIATEVQEI